MLNTLALVSAAAAVLGAPGHGPTPPPPPPPPPPAMAALPDFPSEARPGECWTRALAGPPGAPPMDVGQPVWTLKRGHGPEAVWRFERRPAEMAGPARFQGPYEWVRVACGPHDGKKYADGPPPPPPPPPPPGLDSPVMDAPPPHHGPMPHPQPQPGHGAMAHHGPMGHAAPHHAMPHAQPMPPMGHHPMPHPPMPPMAHHPMPPGHGPMMRPMPGMHPMPHPPGFAAAPPPFHGPFAPPAYAPPPQPPRWFGDRFLTWSGKTGW